MANKVIPNKEKSHRITIKCDHRNGEIILVGGGRNAYLWIGSEGTCATHLSGRATLRKLAKAILAEVGDD
jgi:hypothetical protein